MKRGIVLFLVVLLLSGCGLADHSLCQEEIIGYVLEHVDVLAQFPEDALPEPGKERREFVRETLGRGTVVLDVSRYNDNILEFYCGGSGMGTSSTFSGFYYSQDDTPFGMDFGDVELTQIGTDSYYWQSEDGYYSIRTERILPHWYYYFESHQEPPWPTATDPYGIPYP